MKENTLKINNDYKILKYKTCSQLESSKIKQKQQNTEERNLIG